MAMVRAGLRGRGIIVEVLTSSVDGEGQQSPKALRIALADDDVLLREGLASLLESSGFVVVGQVGDGGHLLSLVRDTQPELVLVDIRMPPTHTVEGLTAAREIRHVYCSC